MDSMKLYVFTQSGNGWLDLEAADLSELELAELSTSNLEKVGGGQSTVALVD